MANGGQLGKRDVPGEILNAEEEQRVPEADVLQQLIHEQVVLETGKKAGNDSGKKLPPRTKKATHCFTSEVLRQLDDAQNTLKEMLPGTENIAVTKSKIVNSALRLILTDFRQRKQESHLFRSILRIKPKKP